MARCLMCKHLDSNCKETEDFAIEYSIHCYGTLSQRGLSLIKLAYYKVSLLQSWNRAFSSHNLKFIFYPGSG